jgi:hypothetical protein
MAKMIRKQVYLEQRHDIALKRRAKQRGVTRCADLGHPRLNQVSVVFTEDFQDKRRLEGVQFLNPLVPGFDVERWRA